jgi:hypothetical protein
MIAVLNGNSLKARAQSIEDTVSWDDVGKRVKYFARKYSIKCDTGAVSGSYVIVNDSAQLQLIRSLNTKGFNIIFSKEHWDPFLLKSCPCDTIHVLTIRTKKCESGACSELYIKVEAYDFHNQNLFEYDTYLYHDLYLSGRLILEN